MTSKLFSVESSAYIRFGVLMLEIGMIRAYATGFILRAYTHATRQKQDKAARTMGDFMARVMLNREKKKAHRKGTSSSPVRFISPVGALRQRLYREPDFSELEEDIENTRQEVRDCLEKHRRSKLMCLVDTQNLLREETSLASFTAGFKRAWGLSKELEADGLYSFDEEETECICHQMREEE